LLFVVPAFCTGSGRFYLSHLKLSESLDSNVSIVGAIFTSRQKLGTYFAKTSQLKHRTNGAASENTFTSSWSNLNVRCSILSCHFVRDRHLFGSVYSNHIFPSITKGFLYSKWRIRCLALTNTDHSFSITRY